MAASQNQSRPELKSGDRLGRFLVERKMSPARRCRTYRARHETLNYPAVVKVQVGSSEPEAELELDALRRLNNCLTPALLDSGRLPDNTRYLVMEHIRGEPLSRLLTTNRRLDSLRATRIAIQLLEALELAHLAGFVHGDIKPGNIMIVPDVPSERVVLLDYGSTRRRDGSVGSGVRVMSTVPYTAPEVMAGQTPTTACDIYAVGAVLYECLSGVRPLPEQPTPPLHEQIPIDQALSEIVSCAMHGDPSARYQGATTMIEALLNLELAELQQEGIEGTALATRQETLDTLQISGATSETPMEALPSRPWYGDRTELLSTGTPLIWALSGDPGMDQDNVQQALAAMGEHYNVVWLDAEARERKRLEYLSGAHPPNVLVFGDLHVLINEPLLQDVSRQGESSCLLVSTHPNTELLDSTVNACGLHGQLCLPQEPQDIIDHVEQLVQRSTRLRKRYDGLRLALRDAQDDLKNLRQCFVTD